MYLDMVKIVDMQAHNDNNADFLTGETDSVTAA